MTGYYDRPKWGKIPCANPKCMSKLDVKKDARRIQRYAGCCSWLCKVILGR